MEEKFEIEIGYYLNRRYPYTFSIIGKTSSTTGDNLGFEIN